jgi:pimeloyl-ACP methyl ester carboxylesterase
LLKTQKHKLLFFASFLLLALTLSGYNVIRKETVQFETEDGLEITADEYIINSDNPYILLLHNQGASRGEYQTIARKLCKMDYNCLAIDLRNGGSNHPVSNETVKRCRQNRCPTGLSSIELDVNAALQYIQSRSEQPVILFGSSENASLSLKIATENENVRAVVAFSPGEYFMPEISIQDTITNLKKPTFVSSGLSEIPYVKELISGMDENFVTLFEPKLGEGEQGIEALNISTENNSEYWLALLLFFKDLV